MQGQAFVYFLANKPRDTLYVGVTNDLVRRVYEHQHHMVDGFTSHYGVTRWVWFLAGEGMVEAIALEKKIKHRGRQWKFDLIERDHPDWDDLSAAW